MSLALTANFLFVAHKIGVIPKSTPQTIFTISFHVHFGAHYKLNISTFVKYKQHQVSKMRKYCFILREDHYCFSQEWYLYNG
jgi:hypothetical protein